ncbi:MAG: hypothetical protein EXR11_06050 [Rhodospirillaceae bacterium]|nr:hypothetical protein [Rhodospirillaceae bacterium]
MTAQTARAQVMTDTALSPPPAFSIVVPMQNEAGHVAPLMAEIVRVFGALPSYCLCRQLDRCFRAEFFLHPQRGLSQCLARLRK